jgi:group I intron endonuclease
LRRYFNINYLELEIKKNNSIIYRSLFKHGYSSFSLEIIEYCDKSEVISREQYYIYQLKPEYNILKIAGSSLGFKHSVETKAKFKNRILTENQKAKQLEGLKIYNSSKEHLEHLKRLHENMAIRMKGRPRPEGAGRPSVSIEVLDTLTNKTIVYPSIIEAARAIGCVKATIQSTLKVLKEKGVTRLIKKKYSVKLYRK